MKKPQLNNNRKFILSGESLDGDRGSHSLKLEDGSRIAVIGGGPAGAFFSYFFLKMAKMIGMDIRVDIYESRDFFNSGPSGCNMCGGIVSESLVQTLATEGINLPSTVVRRGIDSYILHMDVGSTRIDTPIHEKRIGAVYRGAGPRGLKGVEWDSFDGYLLELAIGQGAHLIKSRIAEVGWKDHFPQIKTREGAHRIYDLLAVAVGVNSAALKLFQNLDIGYTPPGTTRTFICEYYLGKAVVEKYLGNSMHTFLLNIPRLEFAALIPKGDYVTICMLGKEIDRELIERFLDSQEVKQCLPPDWHWDQQSCFCSPNMNIQGAVRTSADRIVFIGDSGVSRLYKDGIGAAYRTAKTAATTSVFEGISADDFERFYRPACQTIKTDNKIGKMIFAIVGRIQKLRFARRGILRMVSREQEKKGSPQRMSSVLWDMFTGSAPYKDVLVRTIKPIFQVQLLWNLAAGIWPFGRKHSRQDESVNKTEP
ncbi:NAD(P)/FAD-dependent oxidoreductase [Acidobacteriota bacterium]